MMRRLLPKPSHALLAMLAIAWALTSWFGVRLYVQQRTASILSTNAITINANALALGQSIKERLNHYAAMPSVLSRQQTIQEIASRYATVGSPDIDAAKRKEEWSQQRDLQSLNQAFRKSTQSFGVDVVFLLNTKGYCISASNSYADDSLVGSQFADRIYFIDAMADHLGTQFAVGRKTGVPGLFFAVPLKFGGKIQGALVVKADISRFGQLLSPYDSFITDEHGVVILSRQTALLSHVLPGGNFQSLSAEQRLQQYKTTDLPRLPLKQIPEPVNGLRLYNLSPTSSLEPGQDGQITTLFASQNLPVGNLKLHLLEPVNTALNLEHDIPLVTLLAILAGYFVLGIFYRGGIYLLSLRDSEKVSREKNIDLQETLKAREDQLKSIVDHLPLMVVARDAQTNTILSANPATQTVLQLDKPLAQGQTYESQLTTSLASVLAKPSASESSTYVTGTRESHVLIHDENHVLRIQNIHIADHDNPDQGVLIDLVEDVTDARQREAETHRLAFVDTLTELPNRAAFLKQLNHNIETAYDTKTFGAFFLLDLDGFKLINDRLGHVAGDHILIEVAERIKRLKQDSPLDVFVARLSSDEFTIIFDTGESTGEAAMRSSENFGKAMLDRITLPYTLDGRTLHLTASVGMTLINPQQPNLPDELLKETDAAMYAAKLSHRGGIHFFDEQIRRSLNDKAQLGDRLINAIRTNQFEQYLQPQLDVRGRVMGVEALIRWHDEDLGVVSPAVFIPLAENLHIVVDIDRWVLNTACQTAGSWSKDEALKNIPISVNISAEFFSLEDFVDEVIATIAMHGVHPSQLMIELTEGTVVQDTQRNRFNLDRLQAIGLRVSIDDFGTGNSSLSYMQQFTIDQIKIDQSFVRNMLTNQRSLAIVEFIIKLAKTLGYQPLAEGVESHEQYFKLIELGCEGLQGFYFSPPQPRPACEQFIRERNIS